MDRSNRNWIVSNNQEEYLSGVIGFLEFAFKNNKSGSVPCPCSKCVNRFNRSRDEIFDHLVINRIMRSYDVWYCHGESLSISNSDSNVVEGLGSNNETCGQEDMRTMLNDIFGIPMEAQTMDLEENETTQLDLEGFSGETNSVPHHDLEMFNKLMQDVDKELYPGCKKYNRLSFLLQLYNIKCRFGWVNKSFDVLLKFLKDVLPEGENVPKSFQESQKIIEGLGLSYEKIDACPNDCMLFWKEHANAQNCHVCNSSRWKVEDNSAQRKTKKAIPAKVLRYFPLKPRLKRLYMSSKTASDMIWHKADRKEEDGVLRHPADSDSWKNFDKKFEEFGVEPRNVRLGLASDGFNPFARMDSKYSIWPVILIPYNLPPWLCMKKENFILSLLIPGPKAPGNNIDVYLQPLIEELKELWEVGLPTYDASSKEVFQMHAALNWTINDYPALGNLSGWNIYGKFGCFSCNTNYHAERLKYGQKFCYMNHQEFLNEATASMPPCGSEVLNQLENIKFTLGKDNNPPTGVPPHTWKKKSIFFELPYWQFNLVRHNLDVMHVEKNVCDNVVYTILNDGKKSKDNLKARRDLKHLRIRKKLWPSRRASGRVCLPPACFHLTKDGKKFFLEVLRNVKFPDGYASNISRCVEKYQTLSGLKSHDCHVLMQCLLPIALRGNINDKVASVLVELCAIFRILCGKTLYVKELDALQLKVPRILCCLEKIFPPSFFTIMVHLVVHLVYEAKVAGPVLYRWMYPIERYLKTLKSYVRNKARPEGCIAQSYIADECLVFCSRYLKGGYERNNTRNNAENEPEENDEVESRLFPLQGRPYGSIQGFKLEENMWKQVHRYVLFNYEDPNMKSLIEDHVSYIARITRRRRSTQHEKDRLHSEGFGDWLLAYILMGRRKKPRMVNISTQENMEVQAHINVPSHATNWVSSSCVNDQSSPDALLSEVALESETTNAEKRRGPTLMTHIWNQPTDKRIIVRWNKYWQPVGDEAPILANFLGTIARNPRLCCVKYVDWRFFPKKNRNELLDIVKSKFVIRHPLAEKYVLKSLGKKWSNYKGELKYDHYEPHFGNQTAILKDKPDHVSEDQWKWLVKYWNSPAAKERSEKNRKSRELQDMAHTGGTKSFARYADEKVVDGVLPSRASVYLDTHTKRKVANTPMDEKSKQAVDMIKEKLSELPNGVEETNGRAAWEGDVYSQVMNVVIGPERMNQVRGLGRAPKPFAITSRFEDKDSFDDDDHDVCTEKIESLKCQLKEMKDKLEQNERENANVQSLLNEEIRMLKEVVFARRILEDCNI